MSDRGSLVQVDATDGVATIVLDDVGHRNALSCAMVCAITCAVADVVQAGCRALIRRWLR
jgi:enoyl-CoA hydratase/carnithine racemase